MSFLDKVRKKAKKIASPVSKLGQRLTASGPLKGVKLIGRKVASVAAPINPITGGIGLFVQPKFFNIKNKQNAKIFDRSQQVTRIAATAAVAYVAAPAVLGGTAAAAGGTAAAAGGTAAAAGGTAAATTGASWMSLGAGALTGISRIQSQREAALSGGDPRYQDKGTAPDMDRAQQLDDAATAAARGPLGVPVWGWAAAGVGLVGLFLLARR